MAPQTKHPVSVLGSPLITLTIFVSGLILLFTSTVSCRDTTVIHPATMNDTHGNSADEHSKISYRDLSNPPSESIQCSGCVGDGGIRPFLDGAENFAHLVSPDYPYDLVDKLANGRTSEITDDYQTVIMDNIGLIICLGIGFLFIIIFPIVGCCFCCCRCCGRCGGSRKTDGMPKEGCGRPCLMVTMFVLAAMVSVGGVMVLFTSESISDGLNSIHDDVPANLDALTDFFNDSTKVIDEVATTDLNFTRDVIFRDLDNIGFIFGGMIRDNFLAETDVHLSQLSTSVKRMDTDLADLKIQIPEVNTQLDHLKDNVTAYIDKMTTIKNTFETNTAQPAGDIDTSIDTTQMVSFTGTSQIDNVGNLTEKLDKSLSEIDKIPEQVHNESTQNVADLKTSILDYTSSVTDTTDELDFADRLETDDIKDKIVDYAETALEYDDYRKQASLGLGLIVILIASLLFLGLFFGVCGSSRSTLPHERGCMSNSGGNCLVASVIITFIFGSLLMLLTTLLFAIGSPIESFGCVAFRDTSVLDKLIDDYHILGSVDGSGTFLGDKILKDSNKTMTLTEVLTSCKNNEAIYKAFRINESDFFNITEILDYKSKFSVKDDISSVSVDFSTIKILTPTLNSTLNDLNDTIQYNFTTYTSELSRNATKEAVEFRAKLQQDRATQSAAIQGHYDTTINQLTTALDTEGQNLQDSMDLMSAKLDALIDTLEPASGPSVSEELGTMKTAMQGLDDNLGPAGNTSFNNGLNSFTDRVFGVVDAYIDRLLHGLDYDIGQCLPVWNTYSSIFVENICGTMVASMNGFWFAIGWSLFFMMPGIVVAVKLANHFRRMRLDDDGQMSMATSSMNIEMAPTKPYGQPPPFMHSNKVGHMDTELAERKLNGKLPPIYLPKEMVQSNGDYGILPVPPIFCSLSVEKTETESNDAQSQLNDSEQRETVGPEPPSDEIIPINDSSEPEEIAQDEANGQVAPKDDSVITEVQETTPTEPKADEITPMDQYFPIEEAFETPGPSGELISKDDSSLTGDKAQEGPDGITQMEGREEADQTPESNDELISKDDLPLTEDKPQEGPNGGTTPIEEIKNTGIVPTEPVDDKVTPVDQSSVPDEGVTNYVSGEDKSTESEA